MAHTAGVATQQISEVATQTHQAMHELPNLITLLKNHFPNNPFVNFLHHWENVLFASLVAFIISFVAVRAAKNNQLIPEGIRNFCEAVVEVLEEFVSGILGPVHGPKHLPFVGTIFIYILLMNWCGLIPLFKSPTAAWSTTLALSLTTMVYIQITGIREHGIKHYLLHLAGSPKNLIGWAMVLLMLPLNIILEIGAAPFSLSLRLFANISSEDRLLLNFAELTLNTPGYIGIFFQIFANCLSIIFSIIQAFVFMLLSTVYIALVLPHEEHAEHHKAKAAHS